MPWCAKRRCLCCRPCDAGLWVCRAVPQAVSPCIWFTIRCLHSTSVCPAVAYDLTSLADFQIGADSKEGGKVIFVSAREETVRYLRSFLTTVSERGALGSSSILSFRLTIRPPTDFHFRTVFFDCAAVLLLAVDKRKEAPSEFHPQISACSVAELLSTFYSINGRIPSGFS